MRHLTIFACIAFLAFVQAAPAQEEAKDNGKDKQKSIAELTKDNERLDGLFTLFRDKKSGALKVVIKPDQIGKEFIHFAQASNGAVQAGYFRGAYLANGIISLQRHYDRIEWVAENTAFYFDPESALSRAADANISDAVLAATKIVAEDEASGEILVDATKLFLSEDLMQIKPAPNPDADPKTTFTLGSLSDKKSKILNQRSYPLNTDVEVEYVYSQAAPKVSGNADIVDSRNVPIRVLHSFIEIPENDYQPRRDDPRLGYFTFQRTDLTDQGPTPFRDNIRRWHLVKKNPEAELSEPVEPITWWIENTTPVEYRDIIKDAVLSWNTAFEKAGFKNAMAVKIQPDDAEWDAGDIRYNVLRWTSSPTPPFGGYGPSFGNPYTGQQIGADIMLEYAVLSRYLYARQLLSQNQTMTAPPAWEQSGIGHFCNLSHGLQINSLLARNLATAQGMGDAVEEQLVRDTMYYLILHEVGHTLGLNHNMKATQLLTPEQAFDADTVAEKGLSGSVMDYPAVNFAGEGQTQTQFYINRPGPYDDWAIVYGYSTALSDPEAEEARLQAILARSTEPELVFGNDADDMRSPGKALDPRVNIYDMSSDAIRYASDRMKLLHESIQNMQDHYPKDGQSYQELHDGFLVMLNEWANSANVVSRYIGGVYVDRAMAGQAGGVQPFTPVERDRQQQAMEVLAEQVFAADAFSVPTELYRHLSQQRRGFNFFGATEDPKIHDAVLAIQNGVLNHLLHPVVLKRITDSRLYGNGYVLSEVMNDLNNAIFADDARGNVNSFRQNLQLSYVKRLAAMVQGKSKDRFHTGAQSMAIYNLNKIDELMSRKRGLNRDTQAHVENIRLTVERALSAEG